MDYQLDGKTFSFNYYELRNDYRRFRNMTDKLFIEHAADILHFAEIVCFFKNEPTSVVLSDVGLIHELTHLVIGEESARFRLAEIRDEFNRICELV